jgi:hypothetical protein
VDEQQKQSVFDPAKVIAIGIASPAASFLASRFGVAGTLIGLALSAMILTAVADFLKFSLARTSHAAARTAAHAAHRAAHAAATTKVPRRRGLLVRPFRKTCWVKESVPGVFPSFASSEPIRSDL